MDELEKIKRVMGKLDPDAPHETLLVLDAGTGQNALAQASNFRNSIGVSGIILTKLDGTARGGMIFSVAEQLRTPIRFIGVGEAVEDLRPFDNREFVDALLTDA
jgi:fused signal recognition particle receptor